RIGRTGRAGRTGEAVLFVARREQGMLRAIERATSQRLDAMELPTVEALNEARLVRFQESLGRALEYKDSETNRALMVKMSEATGLSSEDLAVALATLLFKKEPLFLKPSAPQPQRER